MHFKHPPIRFLKKQQQAKMRNERNLKQMYVDIVCGIPTLVRAFGQSEGERGSIGVWQDQKFNR